MTRKVTNDDAPPSGGARFVVELTEQECTVVYILMDEEAKKAAIFAAKLRRHARHLPLFANMARDHAADAATMITIREKIRNACPGLADAETEA